MSNSHLKNRNILSEQLNEIYAIKSKMLNFQNCTKQGVKSKRNKTSKKKSHSNSSLTKPEKIEKIELLQRTLTPFFERMKYKKEEMPSKYDYMKSRFMEPKKTTNKKQVLMKEIEKERIVLEFLDKNDLLLKMSR